MKVTKTQEQLATNLSLRLSRQSKTDSQQSDEQWTMRKSEFYATVSPIMAQLAHLQHQLAQTTQQLQIATANLSRKQQERQRAEQECERMRLLLPVKEQMIKNEQVQVDRLNNVIKQLEKERRVNKIASSKAFLDEQSQMSVSEFDTTRYAADRHLNRQLSTANHHQHLESARLRNQNNKLLSDIHALKTQLTIFGIENEHLQNECRIAKIREQMLTSELERYLEEGQWQSEDVESWTDRRERVEEFVEKIARNHQQSRRQDRGALHPPTPHFSGVSCGFGKKKDKFSSTADAFLSKPLSSPSVYPQSQQVSLGDLQPSLS